MAALAGLAKTTVPGPLTCVHVTASVLPAGRPSSLAVPSSGAVLVGSVIVWSGPASAVGGRLTGGGGRSFSVIWSTPLPLMTRWSHVTVPRTLPLPSMVMMPCGARTMP